MADQLIQFCFSCGRLVAASVGSSCGHDQAPVNWSPDEVGSVYQWSGSKAAVVVSAGRRPTVVHPNGKVKAISHELARRADVILDMSSVPSPLYRLEVVAKRPEPWARGVKKWLAIDSAEKELLATVSDRRLYARSAIAGGDFDSAAKAGLSESEIAWLRMHRASAAGQFAESASIGLTLPLDGYPDKIRVLLMALAHSTWKPEPGQLEVIAGIPDTFAGAKLVKAASALPVDRESWHEIRSVLGMGDEDFSAVGIGHLIDSFELEIGPERGKGVDLVTSRGRDRSAIPSIGSGSIYERIVDARYGVPLVVSSEKLTELVQTVPSVLDDLVDDRIVIVSGRPESMPVGIRARLLPATLSDSEIDDLGHEWERARRAYVAGRLSDAPDSEARGHYQALQALRGGDTSQRSRLVDPTGILASVVDTFDSGVLDLQALNDPTVWHVLDRFIDEAAAGHSSDLAAYWYLKRALDSLFSWDWDRAIETGKQALRRSDSEGVRDEALNLIAFAQFQKGLDESAIKALERALEGEYTPNLQANAGLVAEQMAPDRAAIHLGRLAAEAPNNDLRLAAVRRAFHIWHTSRPAWEDVDDEQLPRDLLAAMRSLAAGDTPVDDHREIMRLLANFDALWVSDPVNTRMSPHAASWDHKLFVARASHDPKIYIRALAAAMKDCGGEKWLVEERNGFVAGLRQLIFEDMENLGPAAFAYEAIEVGLPMEPFDEVTLTCGAFINICRSLAEDGNEPSDMAFGQYRVARHKLESLEPEQRETAKGIVSFAGNAYSTCVALSRQKMLGEGFGVFENLGRQLYGVPSHRIKWSAIAESLRPLSAMANDSIAALARARLYASEAGLQENIDELTEAFKKLRGFAMSPRSAF